MKSRVAGLKARSHVAVVAVIACAAIWMSSALIDAQVPYQRLLRAASEPQNWLTYGGSYKSQRYSALDQINRQTVSRSAAEWPVASTCCISGAPLPLARRTRGPGRPG